MSSDILTTINPAEIIDSWTQPDGTVMPYFDDQNALALLLLNEVVYLSSFWNESRAPAEIQGAISVSVLCGDLFYWGCADAESLPFAELESLYKMWKADPAWGASRWCILRRKQRPQAPIITMMKEAGRWDQAMEDLPEEA